MTSGDGPGAASGGPPAPPTDRGPEAGPVARPARSARTGVAAVALVALANLACNLQGITHPPLDVDQFRQTQTAFAARRLLEGGPLLAYEVPLFGPPWSTPFEFPLYQALCAGLAHLTGVDLILVARLVSLASFYAALAAGWALVARWAPDRATVFVFLAVALSAPHHLYYPRTVMIETLALALALGFLAALDRALAAPWPRSAPWIALAALAGALAALTKSTTHAVALVPGALLVLARLAGARPPGAPDAPRAADRRARIHIALVTLAAVGPGLLAGAWWVHASDAVKAGQPLGDIFVSTSPEMRLWAFGALAQRLDPETWRRLWGLSSFAHLPPALGAALAGAVVGGAALTRSARPLVLAGAAAFLAGPLVFTNLHRVHGYYPMATTIYACAALAAGLCAWRGRLGRPALEGLVPAALVLAGLGAWSATWRHEQPRWQAEQAWLLDLGAWVDARLAPDDVLLQLRLGPSPAIPYFANRRAVVFDGPLDDPRLEAALAAVAREGARVRAVVTPGSDAAEVAALLARFNPPGAAWARGDPAALVLDVLVFDAAPVPAGAGDRGGEGR